MTTSAGKSRKTSWIPLCCVGIGAVKICLMSKATRSGGGRGLRSGNLGEYCVQVSQIVVVFRWKRPEYRADAFNAVAHHAGSLEHHLVALLDQNTPDRQHRVQVTREGGAGNENFHVISPLGTFRRQVTHGRQDSDKIATVLPGHFQCTRRGYRRNAAGKPPADTPLPTRRTSGDARQCDGANGLKGKMPSWGMVLPTHLGLRAGDRRLRPDLRCSRLYPRAG